MAVLSEARGVEWRRSDAEEKRAGASVDRNQM